MQLKLVPGNSAGTVTAYYLSSLGANRDEIDFEFLGNTTGEPYTLHTNVYAQGKGEREQQFRMWFNPTLDFHTYSIVWTPRIIIFLVDNTPIREFKNREAFGVPFPKKQPMRLYSSLWNADEWATRGGLVKTDLSRAPFMASYRNFKVRARGLSQSSMTHRQKLRWYDLKELSYWKSNDPASKFIKSANHTSNGPHIYTHATYVPKLSYILSYTTTMSSFYSQSNTFLLIFCIHFLVVAYIAGATNFYNDFDITWGGGRGRIARPGDVLTLSLDRVSGSGFQSKKAYLFGRIDMQLKLVPGNSAGTVTAYYLSSQGTNHDEIDFEFLGNTTGEPYTLHTNVYAQGKGEREQQFRMWFDPTSDFHTYSIVWTPKIIVFLVDNMPIREFKNREAFGIPFPKNQPMRLYSSLWNADEWATRGGLVKTDWSRAPFMASYRNFNVRAGGLSQSNMTHRQKLRWVRRNHMIYNYCTDAKRFPRGFPAECKL
ncbi:hypothetical protein M8C21_023129, partial [Ambrosia artemisiifolia]